ncbi:MAG: TerB family tellurite resistance protein [Gemmatimonadota bacterium]|jgi:uncharacterized tellurite resistance protein B-like protein
MTDRIRAFFDRRIKLPSAGNGGQAGPQPDETGAGDGDAGAEARKRLHMAACALLLELAHADDEFSDVERTHIEVVLRRHFDLGETEAQELMELAEAERATAIDYYQFTSLIRSSYDLGQKTLLAEVMWGLILADGQIARHEAYLLRKIANLLDLEPGYLAAARKRAAGEG